MKASPADQQELLRLQSLDTRLQQLAHRLGSLPQAAPLAELADARHRRARHACRGDRRPRGRTRRAEAPRVRRRGGRGAHRARRRPPAAHLVDQGRRRTRVGARLPREAPLRPRGPGARRHGAVEAAEAASPASTRSARRSRRGRGPRGRARRGRGRPRDRARRGRARPRASSPAASRRPARVLRAAPRPRRGSRRRPAEPAHVRRMHDHAHGIRPRGACGARHPTRSCSAPSATASWCAPTSRGSDHRRPGGGRPSAGCSLRGRAGRQDGRVIRVIGCRGTSGLRRAGRWVTPTRGNPRDSATESRPPRARAGVRVKRWGKSPPAAAVTRSAR